MTTDQENELYKRAQVIKAKCEEYIKYNYGTDDGAFALGIELLASGQLFTEAAGHACQPATAENHLMFGIKMTKEESAIVSLLLKQMRIELDSNNVPNNDLLISRAKFHSGVLLDELNKSNSDLYDVNILLFKTMARLLYTAINLDLTQDTTVKTAAVACLPSGYEGC
jgi:hypothetical protein